MTVLLRLILPIRLVSEANRASHEHWRIRHKRAQSQRALARMTTAPQVPRCGFALPLMVTLTRIAPRSLDSDNLAASAKAARDGVADALGVDDGDERIEWVYAQRRGKPKEYAVEIVVESRAEQP